MYIPSTTMKGTFYHGSALIEGEEPFTRFMLCGDFEGIWFADNEAIAKEFGSGWCSEDHKIYLYTVTIATSKIANISCNLAENLKEYYGIDDFREIIPYLKEKGFKGWKTPGSIDTTIYTDYCLFYPEIPIIKNVKLLDTNEPETSKIY